MALEQLAPREPEVGGGKPLARFQRAQRAERLDLEQPPLGALVGPLEVQPGGIDAAEHVL